MTHLLLLPLLFLISCATPERHNDEPQAPPVNDTTEITKPSVKAQAKPAPDKKQSQAAQSTTVLIDHKFFQIHYSPEYRLAKYVTYTMTAEQLKRPAGKRKNKFIPDPMLIEKGLPYVKPAEYKKSGYDQGHLAPSEDFIFSQSANDLTFVMSNMTPQKPKLNQQAWRALETKVRLWACGEEKVTIYTGPILKKGLPTLKSGLAIPEKFFKIIIDETAPKKTLAFIYSQTDNKNVLKDRIASVKEIEALTNEDFDTPKENTNLGDWKEKQCKPKR